MTRSDTDGIAPASAPATVTDARRDETGTGSMQSTRARPVGVAPGFPTSEIEAESEPVMLRDVTRHRWVNMIYSELGPQIRAALNDENVTDVLINQDGAVYVGRLGAQGQQQIPNLIVKGDQVSKILHTIARYLGKNISEEQPILEGELPGHGARVNGVLPPVVTSPTLNLRKHASKVIPLEHYVQLGVLSQRQHDVLVQAVIDRRNVLIVGGTGSGKTTFLNSLLDQVERHTPWHRVGIAEDTREIRTNVRNRINLVTTATVGMKQLLRTMLRETIDRIVVGECRGAEVLRMLDAWNTGHPGGFGTLHCDSARSAPLRIEELVAGDPDSKPVPSAIARAVNLIVFLEKDHNAPAGRRVKEILRVVGYEAGKYVFQSE